MKTKILIVDDQIENIKALSLLIESDNVDILSSQSADGALDLLMNHDFALAILDVQMPVTSGFELARLIRGVKKFRHLPIMFVTAHMREQSFIFEGYETGAVDLLFKPLDPHVVRSKVQAFVQIDQQRQILRVHLEEMQKLRIAAESANVAKSRFLANMSHEIRTPLGAVMGFADMISQQDVSDEEREQYAAAIRRNGQLLLRIIDDILDFSKIEAHKLDLEKVPFRLEDVVKDVTSIMRRKAEEKGISFEVKALSDLQRTYLCDPVRLKQILINVIGNAVKFTASGGVKVQIEARTLNLTPESQGRDQLTITVKDSGIGMTEEQIRNLFQPFSQADASTKRQFGGTGLGLVIARELARALEGDLQVKSSQVDQGTTFVMTAILDRENSAKTDKRKASRISDAMDLSDYQLLIVDDIKDNRTLLEKYLEPTGIQVLSAGSGEEALEILRTSTPDLILMDIQMPGMDGYACTQQVRSSQFQKPIIALTAHAMKEEVEKCKSAGCNEVLTKPVDRQALFHLLHQYLIEDSQSPAFGTSIAAEFSAR